VKIRGRVLKANATMGDVASKAAEEAAAVMKIEAPKGDTGRLAQNIDHTPAVWHPGGAGGGGYWEARAGVKYFGEIYPLLLMKGTGQHKQEGLGNLSELSGVLGSLVRDSPAGRIYPRPGNVFPITAGGGLHFRMWQTGMRPQTAWVTQSQEVAKREVGRGIKTFDRLGWL